MASSDPRAVCKDAFSPAAAMLRLRRAGRWTRLSVQASPMIPSPLPGNRAALVSVDTHESQGQQAARLGRHADQAASLTRVKEAVATHATNFNTEGILRHADNIPVPAAQAGRGELAQRRLRPPRAAAGALLRVPICDSNRLTLATGACPLLPCPMER